MTSALSHSGFFFTCFIPFKLCVLPFTVVFTCHYSARFLFSLSSTSHWQQSCLDFLNWSEFFRRTWMLWDSKCDRNSLQSGCNPAMRPFGFRQHKGRQDNSFKEEEKGGNSTYFILKIKTVFARSSFIRKGKLIVLNLELFVEPNCSEYSRELKTIMNSSCFGSCLRRFPLVYWFHRCIQTHGIQRK